MRVTLPHELLLSVLRPGRYVGGERNSVIKDHDQVKVRFALAFPDAYEVGMSHLGLQILYQELNGREDTAAERVFAPWVDMEREMRVRKIPLFSLESRRPVREFDVLGFSVQYELQYTNVLMMLDLAGISLLAADRGEDDPLVCAGGVCVSNPEPIAPLFDFLVSGDGEQVVHEIIDVLVTRGDRKDVLKRLAGIDGVYVPGGYEPEYDGGKLVRIRVKDGFPERVRRRIVCDLDRVLLPDKPVVPLIEAVHDRAAVEVFRGCARGCRFCQAGFAYRPVRERSPEVVRELGCRLVQATGHEELSLLSLSTSDYRYVEQVCGELAGELAGRGVNVSLPSLRMDDLSIQLADAVREVRKSGLTFAPEAGTERLRRVINKQLTDEDIFRTADKAWRAGWDRLKLYFMIGLPTETDDDITGIITLVRELVYRHRAGRREGKYQGRPLKLAVSVAPFVPKAVTPMQWDGQTAGDVLKARIDRLRKEIKRGTVELSFHNVDSSQLEAVMARGDRRLLPVIMNAYQRGCRFDAWTELWSWEKWLEAFADCGVDPGNYSGRVFERNDVLPWDHLDAGVNKEFLWSERTRGYGEVITPSCRDACAGCGLENVCPGEVG